jgi:hypothetical protein
MPHSTSLKQLPHTSQSNRPCVNAACSKISAIEALLPWAVAAMADFLVSRDKDLLTLGSYEAIDMITPESFFAYFARREAHLIADAPHAFAATGISGVGEVAAGIGVIGGARCPVGL